MPDRYVSWPAREEERKPPSFERTYPVGAEFDGVRRSVGLCAKGCVMGATAEHVAVLDDDEIGNRGIMKRLLKRDQGLDADACSFFVSRE